MSLCICCILYILGRIDDAYHVHLHVVAALFVAIVFMHFEMCADLKIITYWRTYAAMNTIDLFEAKVPCLSLSL